MIAYQSWDVAWDSASNKAGIGVIARDHMGLRIGGLDKPVSCATALIAEPTAVLA